MNTERVSNSTNTASGCIRRRCVWPFDRCCSAYSCALEHGLQWNAIGGRPNMEPPQSRHRGRSGVFARRRAADAAYRHSLPQYNCETLFAWYLTPQTVHLMRLRQALRSFVRRRSTARRQKSPQESLGRPRVARFVMSASHSAHFEGRSGKVEPQILRTISLKLGPLRNSPT